MEIRDFSWLVTAVFAVGGGGGGGAFGGGGGSTGSYDGLKKLSFSCRNVS